MPKTTDKKSTSAVQEAHATIRGALVSLRGQIATKKKALSTLQAEAKTLLESPVSFDDYMGFMKADIVNRGLKWNGSGNLLAVRSHEKRPNACAFKDLQGSMVGGNPNTFPEHHDPAPKASRDAFGAMCFFFPDVVATRLADAYSATVAHQWGNDDVPTVEQRKARLTELEGLGSECEQAIAELESELADLEEGLNLGRDGPSETAVDYGLPRAEMVSRR